MVQSAGFHGKIPRKKVLNHLRHQDSEGIIGWITCATVYRRLRCSLPITIAKPILSVFFFFFLKFPSLPLEKRIPFDSICVRQYISYCFIRQRKTQQMVATDVDAPKSATINDTLTRHITRRREGTRRRRKIINELTKFAARLSFGRQGTSLRHEME